MKKLWSAWKKLAERIGNFQATVIFSLLYFIIIYPVSLITIRNKDYFQAKKKPNWKIIEDNYSELTKLYEQ